MQRYLISSLILTAICISIFVIPQASALPVSYNQTALNFGLTSVPRNSSSYDVFPLIPDNWLWEKFDNNTIDSGPLSVTGTVTYNTNLKKLFSFNSVLTDAIGHGNGVVTGTTTYTSGQEGNGFSFNGASYITVSGTGLPNGTSDRSVSFWIKTPSSFANKFLFAWGAGSSNNLFGEQWVSTGSTSKLLLVGFGNDVTSNTTFQSNTWYYLTITLSSSGTVRTLYVNGAQDIQSTTTALNTSTSSLFIGSALGGTIIENTSIINQFRVYNSALTLQQHQALYMVGHYSQSHTFDGGEYVSLGNVFPFERTNPFTLSFWMKSSISTATLIPVINNGINFDQQGIKTYIQFGAVNVRLTNTAGTNEISVSSSGLTTNDGNWHYYVIDYNGNSLASGISIYQDGLSKTVTTNTNNLVSTISVSNSWAIGAFSGGTSPMTGQLDNVKIYPYALSSSQITSDYNSISPISSGKQFMSYYNGVSGSSTLTKKLGTGQSTVTLNCALDSSTAPFIESNGFSVYHACTNSLNHVVVINGTVKHDFSVTACGALGRTWYPFITIKQPMIWCLTTSTVSTNTYASSSGGNQSFTSSGGVLPVKLYSNQEIATTDNNQVVLDIFKYNYNNTSLQTAPLTSTACNINYKPNNTTKLVDSIVCDPAIPANAIRYWNGMLIQGVGNYATNSTQLFLNSVDASPYKKLLTLPCALYGAEAPCITFILTDQTQTDYLVVLTSAHVYYGNAQTALTKLQNNNYALQSYDIITPLTTSAYEIQNPILQGITLYGFNLNTTVNKSGLFTLPSGYTTKTTTINSAIRTIDPRWTNDATDIPIITTTQSLFPLYLTVSNTPAFSAIKVTQGTQIINNLESVYAVAQLDSTRSVEVDLVAGTCANVYIADISISPSIWNFQGIVCATGVNQKTLAYTNTLPLSFFTLKYGVTESYVPSNNGLVTTFHTQSSPTTYNVLVKNSTGTVAINQTFTVPANQTIDTQSFNVSSVSKPAVLVVNVGGNQIYSSYLGSPLSLANMASFFHQYFSYQGFDLLSFIPLIFSAMFTRNTVSVGMALVVVLIATLSFLSIVTVPDTIIYVAIFIAAIGMVGYRGYQAYG